MVSGEDLVKRFFGWTMEHDPSEYKKSYNVEEPREPEGWEDPVDRINRLFKETEELLGIESPQLPAPRKKVIRMHRQLDRGYDPPKD